MARRWCPEIDSESLVMAKTLNDLLDSPTPTLVDFHATWCGPCKAMAPVLQEVKQRLGDRLTIIKIDVDKNPEAAAALQVQGVPTFVLFKQGKILWRQSGAMPADVLQHQLEPHLA